MRCLDLVPCLLLVACGTEPNTSITTSGGSSGVVTTGEPTTVTGTSETSDPTGDPTTGGQGGTGSTGSTGTGPGDTTTGEQTSTATTVGTETTTTATTTTATTTGEMETTGEVQTTGDTGFVDCAKLKADYQAELAQISSCVDAQECGQELKGTSCGCTHNAVARLDADSTQLYDLLMLADEHRCELILVGTCDCPAADGFVCNNGFCGWNYL